MTDLDPDTDVYRVSSTASTKRPLHTKENCPRLSQASSVRGPIPASTFPNADVCGWCEGDAASKGDKDSGRTHLMALKEAAKGDG